MIADMVRKGIGVLVMAFLISLPGSAAWAGGSFAFEDLRPILNQQPELAKWLTAGLEFDQADIAVRLGQNAVHFGGHGGNRPHLPGCGR